MPPIENLLSADEQEVIELLAKAYDKFVTLKITHFDDQHEFRAAIHAAQNIVMCRPAQLEMFRRDEPMRKPV